MVDIEKIKQKYAMDSKGAFGNENNALKRHALRKEANSKPESDPLKLKENIKSANMKIAKEARTKLIGEIIGLKSDLGKIDIKNSVPTTRIANFERALNLLKEARAIVVKNSV